MLDLNKELAGLIEKHGIFYEDKTAAPNNDLYIKTFCELWEQVPKGEPVAIFGLGFAYRCLAPFLYKLGEKNLVCCVENTPLSNKIIPPAPVIKTEELPKYNPSVVFLTGINTRDEVCSEIISLLPNAKVIDVYGMLETKGIVFDVPFYKANNIYGKIYEARRNVRESQSPEQKKLSLQTLISLYLNIRDFVYGKISIDQYIELEFDSSGNYTAFWNDIQSLFENAKDIIMQKKNKNVILFVLDSLNNESVEHMPFIKSQRQNSLTFTNAFTTSPYTVGSFSSFLTGMYYDLDDTAAVISNRELFLKPFRDKGYKFKNICFPNHSFFHAVDDYVGDISSEMPHIYWNFLNDYVNDEGSSFTIVHSMFETHLPFIYGCSDSELMDKSIIKNINYLFSVHSNDENRAFFDYEESQFKGSLAYADKILQFFYDYINPDDVTVIMGDHGFSSSRDFYNYCRNSTNNSILFSDKRLSPALQITSKHITQQSFNGLFSLVNLVSILYDIAILNSIKITDSEYVIFSFEGIYDKSLLFFIEKSSDFQFCHDHKGFIGVRTKTEKYIKCSDDFEYYFILPNENRYKDNLSDNPIYSERLEHLRKLVKIYNVIA